MKNLKKVSNWANYNNKKSRVIIVLLQIALVLTGIFYANLLKENNINITRKILLIVVGIFLITILFYPFKSLRKKKLPSIFRYSYKKQKILDFVISINIFFVVVFMFSQKIEYISVSFVTNVFAEEVPIQYIDMKANINSGFINILVW